MAVTTRACTPVLTPILLSDRCVIVVPVVGVAAHQNLNLFQMPSMMEPPPGMEQADYWVDE